MTKLARAGPVNVYHRGRPERGGEDLSERDPVRVGHFLRPSMALRAFVADIPTKGFGFLSTMPLSTGIDSAVPISLSAACAITMSPESQ